MTFDSHAEYFTYDDVLIKPKKSGVLSRKDVDTSTYLTPNIKLKVPLVTSNMDTVFSEELAENLFKAGGIATLHQFTVDLQQFTIKI
jgi:IMP dehydrogenase